MTRLVTLGECMVELRQNDDGTLQMGYAGDMLNSAFYARRTLPGDIDVRFFSGFGTDRLSHDMLKAIQAWGVKTDGSVTVPERQCGLYMIHLDKGERSFSYWRSASAARLLARDITCLRKALEGAQTVLFSGITLAILEDDGWKNLISVIGELRRAGVRTAFDPNIRTALWTDLDEMRRRMAAAAAVSSIVLPSYSDEAAHFGDDSKAATIDRYLAYGADLVALKDGEYGVWIATLGKCEIVPAVTVPCVVDSTGAGDSFNGIFLARLMMGDTPADAARRAVDGASQVIMHHGAIVSEFQDQSRNCPLPGTSEASIG